MVLNRKAQTIFITFMLFIILIILAIALAKPINDFIIDARNETTSPSSIGLGCDNATRMANETTGIFDHGTCLIVDLFLPYFIGFLVAMAGMIIGAKILLGGGVSE